MPELPEVERARKRLEGLAKGRRIVDVQVFEDTIVYSNVTHTEFAAHLKGKLVIDVKRKGKNFYLLLDSPPHPIFHFGMSGQAFIRGQPGDSYRRGRTQLTEWPPKYAKACLTLADPVTGEHAGEWAFCDARRLGRIKIVTAQDPESVEPLSALGRDPLLDMLTLDEMSLALAKRRAPIKAVLLDQNGPFCGIGNWMVDEILYHAKLHPAHVSSTLDSSELERLHTNIVYVSNTAVRANAEASRFPDGWLFKFRWSKGKKLKAGQDGGFTLPDGTKSKITFVTVGGRTSAVVDAVQKLPPGNAANAKTSRAATGAKEASRKRKKQRSSVSDPTDAVDEETDGLEAEHGSGDLREEELEVRAADDIKAEEQDKDLDDPGITASTSITSAVTVVEAVSNSNQAVGRRKRQKVKAETVAVVSETFALPGLGSSPSSSPAKQSDRRTRSKRRLV